MRVAFLLVALAVDVSAFAQAAAQTAQTPPQNSPPTPPAIWAGVFSPAQADRGAAVVATHCSRCHGEGRSLSGDVFMLHWE
jgi:cytochrome c5